MFRQDNIFKKVFTAGWFFILLLPLPVFAQIDGIGELIRAGREDAELLTREYFRPLPSGFGAGINSGWIHTAEPHSRFGFDIQVRGALAVVPSSAKSFDLKNLNLQKMRASDPEQTITPTLSGSDREGPEVIVEDNGKEAGRFNLPRGTGFGYIPAPVVQAGIGLIGDTDLMFRFVPPVNLGDLGRFRQFGLGAKHHINSTLPGGDTLPVDVSVMAGYNRINVTGDPDVQPQSDAIPDPGYTGDYDNQEVNIGFDTFTVKLLVSKSIPFFTVYGGAGYEYAVMHVDLTGDYPVTISGPAGIGSITETVTDPFGYSRRGDNSLSAMAGFKIKLGLLHLFADYTLARYPVANAGIGVSFR